MCLQKAQRPDQIIALTDEQGKILGPVIGQKVTFGEYCIISLHIYKENNETVQ